MLSRSNGIVSSTGLIYEISPEKLIWAKHKLQFSAANGLRQTHNNQLYTLYLKRNDETNQTGCYLCNCFSLTANTGTYRTRCKCSNDETYILIVVPFLLAQFTAAESAHDVQLLIYETEVSNDSPVNNLVNQASHIPGLTTTVVGQGKKFGGFGSKYESVLPILEQMESDALVVLSDARDVLINNPMDDNLNVAADTIRYFRTAFEMVSFQQPGAIVVSAEAQCCVSALTYVQPGAFFGADGSRTGRACSSGESDCLWNGDEKAIPWENFMKDVAQQHLGVGANIIDDIYLNSGLMVGYVRDVLRVLKAADILATEDDQAVLTDYMHQHPEDIILDYGQTMFGNNRGGLNGGSTDSCMFTISNDGSKKLVHKKTATMPLFVHSPGGYLQCHDDLAEQLGVVAISTKARRRLREWKSRTLNYRFCAFGQKLVSGFCVNDSCNSDFQCPSNSFRISGLDCYDGFDDCQCNNGFYKSNGACVAMTTASTCYQCPMKSNPRTMFQPEYQCKNTMEDCYCFDHYKNVDGYCVSTWCSSNYKCPFGRNRIPGRECYDNIFDCQ